MIDSFSLALTHGLLLLVAWRLLFRPDLDDDPAPGAEPSAPKSRRWTIGKGRADA
ncbi:MAG TPA: hypothetical protein VFQ67_03395 [Allosphingosinicella sp.]|jgi:hypothetical protein|nr:hypothetical protein [Allosphingosinicella sp.]